MKTIPLTHGKVTLVDDEDFEALSKFKWRVQPDGPREYVVRTAQAEGGRVTVRMHRSILNPGPKEPIDHRNGNGLDNRRANLRISSHGENRRNSRRPITNKSGFKGVHFHPQAKKWRACIGLKRRRHSLGLFSTPEAAYSAYCAAAIRLHGEFARFN